MVSPLKTLVKAILETIYPPLCPGCRIPMKEWESLLCLSCEMELVPLDIHTIKENFFSRHFLGRVPIEHCCALFQFSKEGLAQNLVFDIKYNGNKKLAFALGRRLGRLLLEGIEPPDVMIPVPLHRNRQNVRGFNQSLLIGKGIEEVTGWPLNSEILFRRRSTESQTSKGRLQRWKNMTAVFHLKETKALEGKHVLLIDDVMTTGATLEACANPLVGVEGIRLSLCTLATGF